MKIEILNKAKKKKIIQNLEEFGIKKIPELLVRTGRERIRAYSGSLSTEEIYDLWRILPIEGVGLYVAKDAINKKIGKQETRISLDGLHTWKDQITQKIITLTEEQEEELIELSEKGVCLSNQSFQEQKILNQRLSDEITSIENKLVELMTRLEKEECREAAEAQPVETDSGADACFF